MIGVLAHPIVDRELTGMLRLRRTWGVLVASAVVFCGVVLFLWPEDALVERSGASSREVFRLFGYTVLSLLLLLLPAYPATTFVREKRKGTLLLLLSSPLRPWSIYLGKFAGVFGLVILFLVLSLPAAAACYAMGGLTVTDNILPLYVTLAAMSMQYIALGLLVSLFAGSPESALRITYGVVLLLSIVVLVPYQFFQGQEGYLGQVAVGLRSVSPIPVVLEVLGQGDVGSRRVVSESVTVQSYALTGIVSTLGMMLYSIGHLNHRLFDRSRSQGIITDDRTTAGRLTRRLFFLVDPQRRKAGIGALTNPVMVKEFRTRRFGRFHWLLRLVAVCAVLSLGLTYFTTAGTIDWGVEVIGGIMVLLQVSLVMLITPALASGLIAAERETGGWELLQMTPLSAGKILRGKLQSVVWTTLLVLLATLPGYLVMTWIKPDMRPQIIRVLICLGLTAAFALILSATVSSFFRRTAAATVTSYILLAGICGGTMLFWLGRGQPFGHRLVENILLVNPMAAALAVTEAPGMGDFDLVPANWYIMGTACAALLLVLRLRIHRLMQPQ